MNSINDFFQFYKKILKENKDININEEMIFNSLININIPNDQLDIEIDSLFDEWKTKYINYDVTIKNDYIEMSQGNLEVTSKIKVFISLNYNHIYKNINKILNFLNDKSFIIRISKIIRNDNIIILFDNIENVKLLDKFIQDNINEGVLKPNPFTYIYNNIGLTIDGNISFCNTITRVIYEYLLSKKDNIDEIQEVDFYNFIIDKYNNEFINLSTYSNIKIPYVDNILYNEKSIVYYKNLIELLLKSSEEKFNIDKFEKHFKDSNNLDKLIKDKTYAFEKMCFKDTRELNFISNQLGYANKMNIYELKKMINIYCKRFIENFLNFDKEFYPSINDFLNTWTNMEVFIQSSYAHLQLSEAEKNKSE